MHKMAIDPLTNMRLVSRYCNQTGQVLTRCVDPKFVIYEIAVFSESEECGRDCSYSVFNMSEPVTVTAGSGRSLSKKLRTLYAQDRQLFALV